MSIPYSGKLQFTERTVLRPATLLVAERERRGTRKGIRTLTPLGPGRPRPVLVP